MDDNRTGAAAELSESLTPENVGRGFRFMVDGERGQVYEIVRLSAGQIGWMARKKCSETHTHVWLDGSGLVCWLDAENAAPDGGGPDEALRQINWVCQMQASGMTTVYAPDGTRLQPEHWRDVLLVLLEDGRRWYHADGSYELLPSRGDALSKRIAAAELIETLRRDLDEAAEWIEELAEQHLTEHGEGSQHPGWWATNCTQTALALGDWLVKHRGWQHKPEWGHGRAQWFKPPEQEAGQ